MIFQKILFKQFFLGKSKNINMEINILILTLNSSKFNSCEDCLSKMDSE